MKTKKTNVLSHVVMFLVLLPAILLMLFFLFIPFLISLQYSFTNISLIGQNTAEVSFIGIDNYLRLFTSPGFYKSCLNTFILILFSAIIGQQILGFCIAYLLQFTNYYFRKVLQFSISLGWLLPDIVVAFIFYYIFSPEGLINTLLQVRNLTGQSWLHSYGMLIILIADVWSKVAFSVSTYEEFFASLQSEWYEAASIDGASGIQKNINITVPLLIKPAFSNILFCALRTIGVFSLVFLLTGGGPANATNTISLYIFQNTIALSSIGYGASIGVVVFFILFIVSFTFTKINNQSDFYEKI